ncbi:DNA-directed RNA polymerase, mitochondrial-like [Glandiceps talaboti]
MSSLLRCPLLPHYRQLFLKNSNYFRLYEYSRTNECSRCVNLRQRSSKSSTGIKHGPVVQTLSAKNNSRDPYLDLHQEKQKLVQVLENRRVQLKQDRTVFHQEFVRKETEWNLENGKEITSFVMEQSKKKPPPEVIAVDSTTNSMHEPWQQNIHCADQNYVSEEQNYFATDKDIEGNDIVDDNQEQQLPAKDGKKKKKKETSKKKAKNVKTKKMESEEERIQGIIDGQDKDRLKMQYQYLMAFIDACISTNMMERANKHLKKFSDVKADIGLYNLQLQGWARKGEIDMIKYLFEKMLENDVKPDYQSYAAALECLGRRKKINKLTVELILQQMSNEELSIEKIFDHSQLSAFQRDCVLKAILSVQPDYQVNRSRDIPICRNELLKDLYMTHEPLNKPISKTNQSQSQSGMYCDIFNNEELRRMVNRQMKIELAGGLKLPSIEAIPIPDKETINRREILTKHRELWKKSLMATFATFQKQSKGVQLKWQIYPFLCILEPSDYVNIMLDYIPQIAGSTEGETLLTAANALGSGILRQYQLQHKITSGVADKINSMYVDYAEFTLNDDLMTKYQFREYWQKLEDDVQWGPSLNLEVPPWNKVTIAVGLSLTEFLLKEIKIDINLLAGKSKEKLIPGFYHMYAYHNVKQVGFLKPHPALVDLIKDAKEPVLWFDCEVLPMLSPPLPWVSTKRGGYLLAPTKIMRSRDDSLLHDVLLDKTEQSNLYPVFDSLNQLGAVPWKINQRMLDLIISMFINKGSVPLDIPRPVSECPEPPKISGTLDLEEMTSLRKERMALRRQKAEMHSLRMDFLYKLSIANKYRHDIFWFPHNMDFRGRVYPCPPHFNHLGTDAMRSILLFGKGRALGENGLDWLKMHLVNLTGLKKRSSLIERLEYADTIIDEIIDSADNPMTGKKWWQDTEAPWQVLACCMEIANAMRSPDPKQYICHFPVHQDGSCNGLQHYAALGRDVIGAQQVNLHPFDVPQDVYSGVAQKVEETRKKDAANGLQIAEHLDGIVERKVVKQTVMTVVYGVTRYGGHRQILKQLKDHPDLASLHQWRAAGYLVTKVFQSLREMFTKTREIQDWLTDCCKKICKAGKPMQWVTPIGLPIIQPYHKKKVLVISYRNLEQMSCSSKHRFTDVHQKPDIVKQANAFAPNFIHSLDSTHMMLTSLYCQKAGISFVAVHDCYWTHPSTVNVMNEICRQQFVALHKTPILEDLSAFMVEKYSHLDSVYQDTGDDGALLMFLKQIPDKGDFDLENVLESTYFFS